jgi:hypothetical protein
VVLFLAGICPNACNTFSHFTRGVGLIIDQARVSHTNGRLASMQPFHFKHLSIVMAE